jgi:hypothetical protein
VAMPDFTEASIIEVDLDIVTNTIKAWAGTTLNRVHDAIDIAAINTKMLADLRALPIEEWIEAFEESSRRYG